MKIFAYATFTTIKIVTMAFSILPMIAIIWGVGIWLAALGLSFQGFLVAMMIPSIIALMIGGSCYYLLMRAIARYIRGH